MISTKATTVKTMKNNDNKKRILSNRYELLEHIGIGGMSYVYKAYDTRLNQVVAIKILKEELKNDEEFIKKFNDEANSSKEIKHKNVVNNYDIVDEGDLHYIVLEYIEGETLDKYIKKKGKLSNEETINISKQIAKGLEAAHLKGIIHRDIKPQNIIVDKNNVIKITDFGIARAITSTTKNISVIGTVHYISPEQIRNETVDYRSDIYSLGCTMYEMITGETPFKGDDSMSIVIAHLRDNVDLPSKINKDIYKSLEKIILKATRILPRERYQNISDMIDDLDRAIHEKDGDYIVDLVKEDEIGRTRILTDADMKIVKSVAQNLTSKSSYQQDEKNITKIQQEFFDKTIQKRNRNLLRYIILSGVVLASIFGLLIWIILFDSRTNVNIDVIGTSSIINNMKNSLVNIDYDVASNMMKEYNVELNVVSYEFSDTINRGCIIRVLDEESVDEVMNESVFNVVLSDGPFIIDFTDTESLNKISLNEMTNMLSKRDISFSTTEINDLNIPRGYIIGANKRNTAEAGELILTVSRGISDSYISMPDLYGMSLEDAAKVLDNNNLALGAVSYKRNYILDKDLVMEQSVEPNSEVKTGTSINISLSVGPYGQEIIVAEKNYWYSELSTTYRVGQNINPVNSSQNTIILQVRLVQNNGVKTMYTELMEPAEYRLGTTIPLVFDSIRGEEGIRTGKVQIVDVVNDYVLNSYDIMFYPRR